MSGLLARRARKAVAGGGITDPTDIADLSGWWDASDASTFTYHSGTLASEWRDKSGNARHMTQATSGNSPSRSVTVNSLDALDFDGSNHWMRTGSAQFVATTTGSYSAFAVARFDVTSGVQGVFDADLGSSTRISQLIRRNGTAIESICFRSSTPYTDAAGTTVSTATTYCLSAVANPTDIEMFVNGSGNGATATGGNLNSASQPVQAGANGTATATAFLNGTICELVLYSASLSSSDRGDVETYLTDKWT